MAQDNRALYPKVAHNSSKVGHDNGPPAFQVVPFCLDAQIGAGMPEIVKAGRSGGLVYLFIAGRHSPRKDL